MKLVNRRLTAAMAHDLRIALDPAAWAESVGFVPDPWQRNVLRSGSKRIALNCARQSGKSTVAAAIGLHGALYMPGALSVMLSPTLRQSSELFRKSLGLYAASGRLYDAESETKLSLELANGSRLISLPGSESSIRGYSKVFRLIVDEASRVPDELYAAVRPMLAVSDGSILTLSTPFGTRGWWYETMNAGGEEWERYTMPASENPRISPLFLAEEKRVLGEFWYAQEYECRFLDSSSAAFRQVDIDAAFAREVEQWDL
jgi:Terminase large subunit, T4likevirus-type, N-terminal